MAQSIALNIEAKKLTTPTNKLVTNFVGINQLKEQANKKEEVVENVDANNSYRNPFTIDDLRTNWRKFAYIAKEKNQDTLYNAMVAGDPTIGDNFKINYTLSNEVQLEFIKAHEMDIVGYLRKELKNYGVQLNLREESSEGSTKPFTSSEIYQALAKKNPILEVFRKTFNLDLE